jgi:prolipoprotein diacylglyceryl transferase
MYPRLSDLINGLIGTSITLPVQTYGFFVALAFVMAGMVVYVEYRRKEKEKVLLPQEKLTWKGKPAGFTELALTAIAGLALGYKVIGILFNYSQFSENPQKYVLSGEGSWWGGIITAIAMTAYTYYSKEKRKLEKPVQVKEIVHPYQLTGSIILVAAAAGIIGSKLFDVVEHLDQLFKDPIGTLFSFSGLAFYGGLITAAFLVSWYVERNKIPWPINADIVAPGLMLAYGIGRIGCQLSGDGCWGVVNLEPKPEWMSFLPDWMWSFNYPHNVINEGILMEGCDGKHCRVLGQPVFPTPFYETVIAFIFFIALWSIRKKIRLHGMLFAIYLILNGIERLLIEQIRVNIKYHFLGIEYTQASAIAVGLIIAGIAGIIYFRWWNEKRKLKPQSS